MMEDVYSGLISAQEALDAVRYYLNEGDYTEYTEDELKALEALLVAYMEEN